MESTSPHGNRGLSLGAVSAGKRHDSPGLVHSGRSSRGSRHDGQRIVMDAGGTGLCMALSWKQQVPDRTQYSVHARPVPHGAQPGRGGCACAMSCLRVNGKSEREHEYECEPKE